MNISVQQTAPVYTLSDVTEAQMRLIRDGLSRIGSVAAGDLRMALEVAMVPAPVLLVDPRVDVAGITGFQTLMRVQDALVGIPGVYEVTVGSYARGVGGFSTKGKATREEVIAAVARVPGSASLAVSFP